MPVTAHWYTQAFFSAFGGAAAQVDLEADSMFVALLTTAYSESQHAHDYFDDVVGNEVSSANYTAGGFDLVSEDQQVNSNIWNWTAGNPSWTNVTFTTQWAIYYDRSPGTNATRPLLSNLNFGSGQAISGANFSITHDVAGVVKVTVS